MQFLLQLIFAAFLGSGRAGFVVFSGIYYGSEPETKYLYGCGVETDEDARSKWKLLLGKF